MIIVSDDNCLRWEAFYSDRIHEINPIISGESVPLDNNSGVIKRLLIGLEECLDKSMKDGNFWD